jgi:DNA-directed RNA polymerase specialized sigma24 family protein
MRASSAGRQDDPGQAARGQHLAGPLAQEVMLDVWRTASRFDAARGSAGAWVMTIAHRRAVDRVRTEQAASRREQSLAVGPVDGDDVRNSSNRHWTSSG